MSYDILEPERENTPTFKERSELVYEYLNDKLGHGRMGQHNFNFTKVEIESLMGMLSHRFEGVW